MSTPTPVLETPRLLLRPPTLDDFDRWAELMADPEASRFIGGPLLLLLAALAGMRLEGWVGVLAIGAFMAGFVKLVARMKDRPPTDSGPDDGAVV